MADSDVEEVELDGSEVGDSEASVESYIEPDELCDRLGSWFQSSAPKGVIMCSSTYSSYPNPIVSLEEGGIICLPLSSASEECTLFCAVSREPMRLLTTAKANMEHSSTVVCNV